MEDIVIFVARLGLFQISKNKTKQKTKQNKGEKSLIMLTIKYAYEYLHIFFLSISAGSIWFTTEPLDEKSVWDNINVF